MKLLDWMDGHSMNSAQTARHLGISRPTLNRALNGSHVSAKTEDLIYRGTGGEVTAADLQKQRRRPLSPEKLDHRGISYGTARIRAKTPPRSKR
jgi:DNA-binding transcriptional regulator YdaS (Cro superfamily)